MQPTAGHRRAVVGPGMDTRVVTVLWVHRVLKHRCLARRPGNGATRTGPFGRRVIIAFADLVLMGTVVLTRTGQAKRVNPTEGLGARRLLRPAPRPRGGADCLDT